MVKRKRGRPPKPKPEDVQDAVAAGKREALARWRWKVSRAKQVRKDWEQRFKVETLERFFLGEQSQIDLAPEGVSINYTKATLKAMAPGLFFANPKFYVRPKQGHSSPVEDRHAAIGEGLLTAIGDHEFSLENAGRLALLQGFFRIGVMKIVYDPRLEPNPQAGQQILMTDPAGNPMIDPNTIVPLRDPSTGQEIVDPSTGQPVPDPTYEKPLYMTGPDGQPLTEPAEVVTDEAYRYDWVDARRMLLPDEGPDMTKWTWIGEEVVVPLEDAKEDKRFKPSLRVLFESNEHLDQKNAAIDLTGKFREYGAQKETELFRYFECWDIRNKRLSMFAEGQSFDDFLYEGPFPDGVEDHPYAILPGFTPVTSPDPLPWPHPEVHSWLDLQREYNTRRSQITEGAKRSARKVYFDDNTFPDADEATKSLQSPRDMEAVRLNDVGRPPVVQQDPPLPADILRDVALLQLDWKVVTGQSGARLAQPDAGSATEATFMERASNIRDVDMQAQVSRWLSTAGMKMLQRVRATLTLEMWVKMRGFNDDEFKEYFKSVYGLPVELMEYLPGLKESFKESFGKERWQRVTRDMLEFEAEVQVVPGSSRPRNLDVERSQWLQFLQVIGQFPQLALSRELLRETAKKFEHIPERMLDEITALAKQMVQINANQAGRNQGSGPTAGNGAVEGGGLQQALAGLLSGPAVTA